MRGVLVSLLRRGAREKVEMQKQGFIWKSGAAAMVNGLSSRPPPCMPLVLRYVHMPPPPNMPGTCICPIPTGQRHGVWWRGGSLSLTSQAVVGGPLCNIKASISFSMEGGLLLQLSWPVTFIGCNHEHECRFVQIGAAKVMQQQQGRVIPSCLFQR